jgi:hypothetical protein
MSLQNKLKKCVKKINHHNGELQKWAGKYEETRQLLIMESGFINPFAQQQAQQIPAIQEPPAQVLPQKKRNIMQYGELKL